MENSVLVPSWDISSKLHKDGNREQDILLQSVKGLMYVKCPVYMWAGLQSLQTAACMAAEPLLKNCYPLLSFYFSKCITKIIDTECLKFGVGYALYF
jgi:hypothetical protein